MRNDTKGNKWPDGYCLDPNGKMSVPAGKEDDFNFGYEIGFQDAWQIMNEAIRAADRARFEAGKIAKEIQKRKAANSKLTSLPLTESENSNDK